MIDEFSLFLITHEKNTMMGEKNVDSTLIF